MKSDLDGYTTLVDRLTSDGGLCLQSSNQSFCRSTLGIFNTFVDGSD